MPEIENIIQNISYPGAFVVIIYMITKSPLTSLFADWLRSLLLKQNTITNEHGEVITLQTIDERVKLLASNHFHEIKESLDRMEIALRDNNRMTGEVQKSLEFLKGRINGKH